MSWVVMGCFFVLWCWVGGLSNDVFEFMFVQEGSGTVFVAKSIASCIESHRKNNLWVFKDGGASWNKKDKGVWVERLVT